MADSDALADTMVTLRSLPNANVHLEGNLINQVDVESPPQYAVAVAEAVLRRLNPKQTVGTTVGWQVNVGSYSEEAVVRIDSELSLRTALARLAVLNAI